MWKTDCGVRLVYTYNMFLYLPATDIDVSTSEFGVVCYTVKGFAKAYRARLLLVCYGSQRKKNRGPSQ